MNQPLITKYRPINYDEFIGHEDKVNALKRVLISNSRPHAFLLTGPSGVGKTTLARIIAKEIEADLLEVDAGASGGIDSVRDLVEQGQYHSLSGAACKMFIIDEAHGLSKNAFQALLKFIEEPPEHLYLALCTTEAQRIPDTIQTRCYQIPLKALSSSEIAELLEVICELEELKPKSDVLQVVISESKGSPRRAITYLQCTHDAETAQEARRVISLQTTSSPIIELLQLLVSGKRSWEVIRPCLQKIDEADDYSDVMLQAAGYIISVMTKEKGESNAIKLWMLLEALVAPITTFDRKAMFIAAVGKMLWASSE